MSKRRVLLIAVMAFAFGIMLSLTAFAANEPVSYKVQTDSGVIERTTTVGILFNVQVINSERTITDLNTSVDGFPSSKIIEVHVPNGISKISINTENSSVETIIFDYYCEIDVTDLRNLTNLKRIEVSGVEAQVTFGSNCAPSTLTELSVTSTKAKVVFEENAFKDITSLKTVRLDAGTDPSMPIGYTFGAGCFRNTGIEDIVLNDGAVTYTFSGSSTFADCASLKSVYLGESVTSVGSSAFENCGSLESVYSASLTTVSDNTFGVVSGSEKSALKIYIHSQKKVTIGSNAFSGRSNMGVTVCALETDKTSFSNCKYELHYGIPHKYMPSSDHPICYTSYVTDCPCGKVGNAYYRLYASGQSVQTVMLVAGTNPDVPHSYTGAYKMEYANGIDKEGIVELKCGVCGALEGVTRTAPAVVEFLGYSVSETGDKSMVAGIRYNYASLKQYEEINGTELDYGFIMAAAAPLGDNSPLTQDGEAYSNSVYKHAMSDLGLYESTLKLTNLKDTMLNTKFIFAGYIKIGKEILYIQDSGVTSTPVSVTYSQLTQ